MPDYYSPPEVVAVLGCVDTYLRWRHTQEPPRGFQHFHPSAFGKAQPLDAMIQTPYGPKAMGDIRVGDEVCAVDGTTNTVVQIHPQGVRPIFRVTFSDGDSTECCEDHLWEVDSRYMGFKAPKVMSLKEIEATYLPKSGHHHYRVRVPEPLLLKGEWDSILSPYLLGVLLGDGCFRCGCPMITGNDDELLGRVRDELPDGVSLQSRDDNMQHWLSGKNVHRRNIVKAELHRLGLWGIASHERFIPDVLMHTDEGSRWSLLQGLMDADGTASKKGHPSFTSVSRQLAMQVAWLVKSLGGLTRWYECEKICTSTGKAGRVSYTVHIAHAEPEKLFHLSRKAARAAAQRGRRVVRNIANVEAVGSKECQCITVSRHDGLYLTDNCIVTHNCLRHMQYDRYHELGMIPIEAEPPEPHMIRIWENGHAMHARWRDYFDALGVLRGVWQCKNATCAAYDDDGTFHPEKLHGFKDDPAAWMKARRKYGLEDLIGVFRPQSCLCGCTRFEYHEVAVVSEELNFKGHCDGILDYSQFDPGRFMSVRQSYMPEYLPTKPIVVDFKSCNTFDFQVVSEGNPHDYYLTQLTIYANLLDCEYALLLYENKNNQKTMAFRVDRNEDTVFARIKRQANELIDMFEVVDEEGNVLNLLPPPKPLAKEDKECQMYCPFKEICHASPIWDDPALRAKQVEFYGG